jgi:putative ABC transport system permease protein
MFPCSSLADAQVPIWAARDTARVVTPLVEPLRERLVVDFKTAGTALGIAAALVLCIACANVAGTMLARSIARRHEIGIRVALGASGSRVVRLLFTESLLLSGMAGVIGCILARLALGQLAEIEGLTLPVWAQPKIGITAIAFSLSIVTLSAFVFGMAPALQLRKHMAAAHGAAASRTTSSIPERRMLSALVVSEIALATTLLICSALLFKAYTVIRHTNPGFRTEGVVTFRMSLPDNYPNAVSQVALYNRVLDRLRALPRVDHVGGVTCLPLSCHNGNFFRAEHAPPSSSDAPNPVTNVRYATPGYFTTMGVVLKLGRMFREGEGHAGPQGRVAVINEQLARHLWPDADAIGKRFNFSGATSSNWITVVGVVRDVRHYGLVKPMIPGLYLSTTALDSTDNIRSLGFAVHAALDAEELLPLVRNAVREVAPDVPLFELQTMRAALDKSTAQQRLITLSLVVFAAIALCLSMGGIYAVLSYVVGRRRRELAIRMAVGAHSAQVLRLVLRQGLVLTSIGLVIGIPLAATGARGLSALLQGVSSADVPTYLMAITLLVAVAMLAAAIPALRASRLEPKSVLSE